MLMDLLIIYFESCNRFAPELFLLKHYLRKVFIIPDSGYKEYKSSLFI